MELSYKEKINKQQNLSSTKAHNFSYYCLNFNMDVTNSIYFKNQYFQKV